MPAEREDKLGGDLRALLETMSGELPATATISPSTYRRARRRVLRTGAVVTAVVLAVSVVAVGSVRAWVERHPVPSISPSPSTLPTLSVPSEVGGQRLVSVERGGADLAGLPAANAVYSTTGNFQLDSYGLELVDLPITSHSLDGMLGRRRRRDVRLVLEVFGGLCNKATSGVHCGLDRPAFGGKMLRHRLSGTEYGCVPVEQPDTTVGQVACAWTDADSFAILSGTTDGFLAEKARQMFVALRRAHDDAITGVVASCSLPTLAGCPTQPSPSPPAGGRPGSQPGTLPPGTQPAAGVTPSTPESPRSSS